MLYTSAEYGNALNSIESTAARFKAGQLPAPLAIKSERTGERVSGTDAFGLACLILSDVDTFGHDAYTKPLRFTISGEADDGNHDTALCVFVDKHRNTWSRWYYMEDFTFSDPVDDAEHLFCQWVCDVVVPRCIGLLAHHSKYDGRGHLLKTVYGPRTEK